MKTLILLLVLGYIILCIIPKDKYKDRWFYLIDYENKLRRLNLKNEANKFRKMRKKAKKDKNLAKYLDSLEAGFKSASLSNCQQEQLTSLHSQILDLQRKNQQLEWETKQLEWETKQLEWETRYK